MELELSPRQAGAGNLLRTADGWRLEIPAGPARSYRLAQIDDYARLHRRLLKHRLPLTLSLRARLSGAELPGTWGFGLWNDPFGLSLGFGAAPGRLPALPQVAWFMSASPPNWLSIMPNPSPNSPAAIPANGFFAGAIRSAAIPPLLFAPAVLALPFLALRPLSRLARRLAGRIVHQDAAPLALDVTQWHTYSIDWLHEECLFHVDGVEFLRTPVSPLPPLALVIWIDNQYAAWTPQGRLSSGTLANPAAWLELQALQLH